MLHNYKAPEIGECLGHSRVVYIGDSIARQQFFAAIRLVQPSADLSGEAHVNRKYVFNDQNLVMEFWWDPYLNETKDILQGQMPSAERPSLLVVGTGAWQMHYLGTEYFDEWKKAVDLVFDSVQSTSEVADNVLLSPVEWPNYERLGVNRSATMTNEKISRMNNYLKERESQLVPATPFAVPFVWNQVSIQAGASGTEDGLHFNSDVTTAQAQIALNYRCNNQLDKKFPFSNTCCFEYPKPRWYQVFFMILFFVWAPIGFFIKNSTAVLSNKLFPAKKTLNAIFVFGLCVMYMYYCDRTQLFGKIQKNFNSKIFTVFGMVKLQHKKEGDQGFLNRHQTDEWKGWMQVIILVYHFCGASGTSGIYNAVRILVAAYLFQTGYGHFFFFYKKADFGIFRILNVMVRLNFLTFVLQYLMDTDYLSYYFTPLVSFWFLAIWLIMYTGNRWNKVPIFMLAKLVVSCCVTTAFIRVPGILEFVFSVLETLFNVHWNAAEWRFRLALDAYIVYVGMLCAFAFIKITEHKITDHPRWSLIKQSAATLSMIAMVWYFWFELTRENKFVYNTVHPYISWIPILAFVVLRNMNVYLRNTHSEFYAFIGKISLETFIGQFHMWLAGDTKGLLVILASPNWVAGLGWWINLAISSCLFIFVSYYMSQTTHEISSWICKHAQSSSSNTTNGQGEYQAVPLLPTTANSTKPSEAIHAENKTQEAVNQEQDEEIWDSSFVNEKKPSLLKRLLDDTRVKSLLFLFIVGLLNNLC
ncbi:10 TM acyl transferase domain found in Cas1p-domain-containing protein [Gilbertella persicaria]|uniref:10 TM acyl transferase domain found in Cas1p-domain-containing protein n=1 Tax=Gilbertella persicaria TaxID=101096 RepID=UPI00221EDE69|nr:10 TM acyl transferase domain found in Cas1p-domain-containing protein [Gilbertella persicaria]KAI8056334.1 10 TM acyl transferase domain found in Cas1p-domain-containing protein [Gilbertella persicaria]